MDTALLKDARRLYQSADSEAVREALRDLFGSTVAVRSFCAESDIGVFCLDTATMCAVDVGLWDSDTMTFGGVVLNADGHVLLLHADGGRFLPFGWGDSRRCLFPPFGEGGTPKEILDIPSQLWSQKVYHRARLHPGFDASFDCMGGVYRGFPALSYVLSASVPELGLSFGLPWWYMARWLSDYVEDIRRCYQVCNPAAYFSCLWGLWILPGPVESAIYVSNSDYDCFIGGHSYYADSKQEHLVLPVSEMRDTVRKLSILVH